MTKTLAELSPIKGTYYLVERTKVDELYQDIAQTEDEDSIPNFLTIDGQECLFTENFIEKDGKEYEIVIAAEGFRWSDVLIYDEDDEDEDDEDEADAK